MSRSVQIHPSWYSVLKEEFEKEYFESLIQQLKSMKRTGHRFYPPGPLIFNAFNTTPFEEVKVVILGQDPYHGPGQAMGLSFSVSRQVPVPASLKNIYKELNSDVGATIPQHGDLSSWAHQGVFLLNAVLTVEHKKAGSHRHLGWQQFTDAVIAQLSEQRSELVFLLWGNFARSKRDLIDAEKHLILEAAHPSPLARGAFFGCKHFSKTNEYLSATGQSTIQWQIEQ